MGETKRTIQELMQKQALPLSLKIRMTQERIRQWVNEYGLDGVYVSFSGGKDSTVLLDIARKMYPNIKAMFVDVPTQYPELKQFVKTFENVDIVRPQIGFKEVCAKYGFPLISKEVSECVYGAKRYLASVLAEMSKGIDRQTDRQTDRQIYSYYYDKLNGQGEYSKCSKSLSSAEFTRGGVR